MTTTHYAFVHGGGQGSWIWAETIAALRLQAGDEGTRTLALDIPGCGEKRERQTDALGFDEIVDELIAEIRSAGLRDVVLVGHSQAGGVLPALLDRDPGLFRRLVYVSCSLPLPGQTVIQMIGNSVHGENENEVGWPVDPTTTTARERTRVMLCNDMTEAEADAFMARLGGDTWPASTYTKTDWTFSRLSSVPATFVYCLRDNILPVNWQAEFARRFRVTDQFSIDAGHQVMNTRPHALAEALRHEAGRD